MIVSKKCSIYFSVEERDNILSFAMEQLHEPFFMSAMNNLSIVEDKMRFSKWYHGLEEIRMPSFYSTTDHNDQNIKSLRYMISTYAVSGTISTRSFGEELDKSNFDRLIDIILEIFVPTRARRRPDVNLCFEIEKYSLKNIAGFGFDRMFLDGRGISADKIFHNENISMDGRSFFSFEISRAIQEIALDVLKADKMPGFKISWYFSESLSPKKKFLSNKYNVNFRR